jgi:hypothetical protein
MAATDLCSKQDVLKFLGMEDDSIDKVNELIERLITAKTSAIANYIGHDFVLASDYTEYYNGDGGRRLYTDNYPINSVTLLNDDIDWDFDSSTDISSDDYRISNDKRYILLKDDIFTEAQQNVKITYNAGYTSIPDDLKQVCVEEVSRSYNEKLNIGISSRTDAKGGTTRVEKGWMKQSVEVMDRYRRWALI